MLHLETSTSSGDNLKRRTRLVKQDVSYIKELWVTSKKLRINNLEESTNSSGPIGSSLAPTPRSWGLPLTSKNVSDRRVSKINGILIIKDNAVSNDTIKAKDEF